MIRRKIFSTVNNMIKLQSCSIHTSPLRLEDLKIEKTVNQVTLLGRVGNDPQKRGTEEHPVVTFSLATHNNYKYESGDMLQRTDWHRISVFRPYLRDTVLNYLKKGQRVFVTGRMTYGEFKGDDGNIRHTSAVVADDVIFFHSGGNAPQSQDV